MLSIAIMVIAPLMAFAQDAAEAVADVPVMDFMAQVFEAVKGFGGMSWGLKVAAILFLVIGSMKVSILRTYTWDKVPAALKVWLAPFLAFLAGMFSLGTFDKVQLAAWAFAGAGAVLLDQVLDGIKKIPGIGAQYIAVIDFISMLLRKPKA